MQRRRATVLNAKRYDVIDLAALQTGIAWPFTILLAWLVGEHAYRLARLPRISSYAFVGFVLAPTQAGFLPVLQSGNMMLLAHIAISLILFECGYRINLRWLRANPWIAVTSLSESALTFVAVYLVLSGTPLDSTSVLLLAALAMATSPVTIVRVVNEQHSSGQATERVLHLATMNSVLAVFVLKIIVGLMVLRTSGNIWNATYSSLVVLAASVVLGTLASYVTLAVLRSTRRTGADSTLAFTIAVICLIALTYSLNLSPVLAALTFGMTARHRRMVLNPSQRGFGALGDLFAVLLFVFIGASLEWHQVKAGIGIGLALIVARQLAKTVGMLVFAHVSGINWRKGLLISLASIPTPAFVILVLERTNPLGVTLVDQLAPLAAATLVLEVLGPILVERALFWANEIADDSAAPDHPKQNYLS